MKTCIRVNMGTALQQLSFFKISHGCKMMQLQYICAKLELNQAAQRFSANISTNVPLHACHACIYNYKHIHTHINSTRNINRSRYTYISLHMSDLCKIPKDLFTQIFDVFFPGLKSTVWDPPPSRLQTPNVTRRGLGPIFQVRLNLVKPRSQLLERRS